LEHVRRLAPHVAIRSVPALAALDAPHTAAFFCKDGAGNPLDGHARRYIMTLR
jgi:hypothetical protein